LTQTPWGTNTGEATTPRRRPVAEVFDEVFRLYRENFKVMVLVFGAFQVPIVLLTLPLWTVQADWWQARPLTSELELFPTLGWLIAASVGFTLAAVPLATFGWAAIAHVVRRSRTGDQPSTAEVFRALRRGAGPLLGLALLLLAGLLGACLALGVMALALLAAGGPGAAIGIAVLGGLVAVVVLGVATVRLSLAIPTLVVERRGSLAALRRSWELAAGSTLRTLGILTLGGLVVGLVGGLLNPVFIPDVAAGLATGSAWSYTIVGAVSGLAQVLVGPILPTLMTVLYFDYAGREPAGAG
jgi:hypothetical protein